METGDKNPGKVDDIRVLSNESTLPDDFLSPDGSSPLTSGPYGTKVRTLSQNKERVPGESIILDPDELVRDARTNPLYYTNTKNEILMNYCTNYSDLVAGVPEELVRHVCTIYSKSKIAPHIIGYIMKNKAFLVPTMRHELGLKKRTIYQILSNLWPWVKKTDKTVEHPGRRPGPRPHVWIVDGEDLIEGVEEARTSYYDTLKQHDPALKHVEGLKVISARIAHQLIDEGVKLGNPDDLMKICQGIPKTQLHPTDYPTIESQVFAILREHREGA